MVVVCVLLWFVKLLFLFCTKCISDEECVVHSFLPSYTATKMDDQSFDLTHLHKRGNQKENKIQSKEREREELTKFKKKKEKHVTTKKMKNDGLVFRISGHLSFDKILKKGRKKRIQSKNKSPPPSYYISLSTHKRKN
jgi:hypothetical protein